MFLNDLGGGGAERVVINLAAGFHDRGFPVDLVLVRAVGPNLERVPSGVRVVDLACHRHLAALPGLIGYLRRERPAVLLSSLTHSNLFALAAHRLAGSSARIVLRVDISITHELRRERRMPVRWLRPAFVRGLYPAADAIVAVSSGAGEDLRDAVDGLRAPVHVIPNPVLVPRLFEQARAPLDHPWFTPGALPVLLGVGRLTPQKDMETLLRAFARAEGLVRSRLVVLGEGEERPRLERLVRDLGLDGKVQLPGFVANPYPFMAAARGVVLSSRYEGSPSVLIEALALGTPVASTDCPAGPREMLEHGRWGRLVEVGDEQALAEAMVELLNGVALPAPGLDDLAPYWLEHAVERYLEVLSPNGAGSPGARR